MSVTVNRAPALDENAPGADGYEAAMDRMEAARRGCRHARQEAERIVREAADENLSRFEASPGIPLRS